MQQLPALPPLICASHTISGSLPGLPARHSFSDRVRAVADAGFDGLVIHFRDHMHLCAQGADPAVLQNCVEKAGLRVPAVEFLADWHDGSTLGSLDHAIDTARRFGATHINVGADLAGNNVPMSDLIPPFRQLTAAIGDAGFIAALEVIAWGTIGSVNRAMELIDFAEGPVGLLLDNWHLAIDGCKPSELPDPSLVVGLQISDAPVMKAQSAPSMIEATTHRLFPGEGALDISTFLATFWPAALQNGVAVEVISGDAAARSVEDCARHAVRTGRRALLEAATIERRATAHD